MDPWKRDLLHYAAAEGKTAEALRLITGGADVDAQDSNGMTPLHFAAQEYASGVAALLLEHGADVELKGRYGNIALGTAVANSLGRGEIIKLLRDDGADPRTENNHGKTPLYLARLIANYDIAQYFSDLPEE